MIHRIASLSENSASSRMLLIFSFTIFFWTLFEGSFSYLVPIVITQSGYSKTFMGILIASASVFGAAFDLLLSKTFHNMHYRRMFLLMFIFCFIAPFLLLKNNPLFLYIAAMAFWGFYYDLSNYGESDFVGRTQNPKNHSKSSGIIWSFRALGYTLSPIIIGIVIANAIDFKPYLLMFLFISISFLFFLYLAYYSKESPNFLTIPANKKIKTFPELILWKKMGIQLLPVLLMTAFFWIVDAFFWTIGPLIPQTLNINKEFQGLFLTLYTIPPLFIGFIIGKITHKLGKKRTAQFGCLIASLLLSTFLVITNPYLILIIVFFASMFIALTIPALNGAYTDYISESSVYEKEIEALQDFSTNVGYIIGPIFAGFLADVTGNLHSFAFLGVFGIIITTLIMLISPRHITIKVN